MIEADFALECHAPQIQHTYTTRCKAGRGPTHRPSDGSASVLSTLPYDKHAVSCQCPASGQCLSQTMRPLVVCAADGDGPAQQTCFSAHPATRHGRLRYRTPSRSTAHEHARGVRSGRRAACSRSGAGCRRRTAARAAACPVRQLPHPARHRRSLQATDLSQSAARLSGPKPLAGMETRLGTQGHMTCKARHEHLQEAWRLRCRPCRDWRTATQSRCLPRSLGP